MAGIAAFRLIGSIFFHCNSMENREYQNFSNEQLQKERPLEEIREVFKLRHLIIDDGYNYESQEISMDLPTLFHGTSAWFEEDIKDGGIQNKLDNVESLKAVFSTHPLLADLFRLVQNGKGGEIKPRLQPDKHAMRRKVYCTYNHEDATFYGKGPEILREYIELMEVAYKGWYAGTFKEKIPEIIEDIQPIESYEKKMLMSCLQPKALIAYVKPTSDELDDQATLDFGQGRVECSFLTNNEDRVELQEKIRKAKDRYVRHLEGDLVTLLEANQISQYVQVALGVGNLTSFELKKMPLSDLIQIYLRSRSGFTFDGPGVEVLFHEIKKESIKKLEEVKS